MVQIISIRETRRAKSLSNTLKAFYSTQTTQSPPEVSQNKTSILDIEFATKHCSDQVKKFDYYAFRVGSHLP